MLDKVMSQSYESWPSPKIGDFQCNHFWETWVPSYLVHVQHEQPILNVVDNGWFSKTCVNKSCYSAALRKIPLHELVGKKTWLTAQLKKHTPPDQHITITLLGLSMHCFDCNFEHLRGNSPLLNYPIGLLPEQKNTLSYCWMFGFDSPI